MEALGRNIRAFSNVDSRSVRKEGGAEGGGANVSEKEEEGGTWKD